MKFTAENERHLKFLQQCKEKLVERVRVLSSSSNNELAALAMSKLLAMTSNSSDRTSQNASTSSTSTSASNSGQTSGATTPPMAGATPIERRKSFSPGNGDDVDERDVLKSSSSANDLSVLEQIDKPKKTRTSRFGSTIKK